MKQLISKISSTYDHEIVHHIAKHSFFRFVVCFSFIFKDQGIFVFESAASGTVTIIGVVDKSQTCSNSVNGIGAAMVTDKSLSQIGIAS